MGLGLPMAPGRVGAQELQEDLAADPSQQSACPAMAWTVAEDEGSAVVLLSLRTQTSKT